MPDHESSVFGGSDQAGEQPYLDKLIAALEAATKGSRELDLAIAEKALGLRLVMTIRGMQVHNPKQPPGVSWDLKDYTTDTDDAMTLLPDSVTNFHLFSFGGHGRDDVTGDCWGCQVHDTKQLVGASRAARAVKRLKPSFEINGQPRVRFEKAIAEQFCDFGATHAANPALAVCIVALKVRCGRTVDDDLWLVDAASPAAQPIRQDAGSVTDEN